MYMLRIEFVADQRSCLFALIFLYSCADMPASANIDDIDFTRAALMSIGGKHHRSENIFHQFIGSENFNPLSRHIGGEVSIDNFISAKALAVRDTHARKTGNFEQCLSDFR